MFAHRVKLDVFDQNDLARVRIENRVVDDVVQTLPVAVGQELEGAGGAIGRLEQSLALRIFADRFEQIVERAFHSRELWPPRSEACSAIRRSAASSSVS